MQPFRASEWADNEKERGKTSYGEQLLARRLAGYLQFEARKGLAGLGRWRRNSQRIEYLLDGVSSALLSDR